MPAPTHSTSDEIISIACGGDWMWEVVRKFAHGRTMLLLLTDSTQHQFINSIVGRGTAATSSDLSSCTSAVQIYPYTLPDGRQVLLFDTPGFNAYFISTDGIAPPLHYSVSNVVKLLDAAHESRVSRRHFTYVLLLHSGLDSAEVDGLRSASKCVDLLLRLCDNDPTAMRVITRADWDDVGSDGEERADGDNQHDAAMGGGLLDLLQRRGVRFLRSGTSQATGDNADGCYNPREIIHNLFTKPSSTATQSDATQSFPGFRADDGDGMVASSSGPLVDMGTYISNELDGIKSKLVSRLHQAQQDFIERLDEVIAERDTLHAREKELETELLTFKGTQGGLIAERDRLSTENRALGADLAEARSSLQRQSEELARLRLLLKGQVDEHQAPSSSSDHQAFFHSPPVLPPPPTLPPRPPLPPRTPTQAVPAPSPPPPSRHFWSSYGRRREAPVDQTAAADRPHTG